MKIKIRIIDNVLSRKEWPVHELNIDSLGNIKQHIVINDGVYNIESFLGKTVKDVLEWTKYDGTGEHPEIFHEIWIPKEEKWDTFVKELPGHVIPSTLGKSYYFDSTELTKMVTALASIAFSQIEASVGFFTDRQRTTEDHNVQDMAHMNIKLLRSFYEDPTRDNLKAILVHQVMVGVCALASSNHWQLEPLHLSAVASTVQAIINDLESVIADLSKSGFDDWVDMVKEREAMTESK